MTQKKQIFHQLKLDQSLFKASHFTFETPLCQSCSYLFEWGNTNFSKTVHQGYDYISYFKSPMKSDNNNCIINVVSCAQIAWKSLFFRLMCSTKYTSQKDSFQSLFTPISHVHSFQTRHSNNNYSYHTHELQDINLIFLLEVLSSGVI